MRTDSPGGSAVASTQGKGSENQSLDNQWSCFHCTLLNDVRTSKCAACYSDRPRKNAGESMDSSAPLDQTETCKKADQQQVHPDLHGSPQASGRTDKKSRMETPSLGTHESALALDGPKVEMLEDTGDIPACAVQGKREASAITSRHGTRKRQRQPSKSEKMLEEYSDDITSAEQSCIPSMVMKEPAEGSNHEDDRKYRMLDRRQNQAPTSAVEPINPEGAYGIVKSSSGWISIKTTRELKQNRNQDPFVATQSGSELSESHQRDTVKISKLVAAEPLDHSGGSASRM